MRTALERLPRDLREGVRFPAVPLRVLEVFRAEAFLFPPDLREEASLRAPPLRATLLRADPPLCLLRPAVFRAEVRRRREPVAPFLPLFDPPRDVLFAAAMISAPRKKCPIDASDESL
jgi:hypothetical protein